jgi:hypothetical protein
MTENRKDYQGLEGDRAFIDEFLEGLDKEELKELKSVAKRLMEDQCVPEFLFPVLYRNCYKYIAARRKFKYEIEAYTNIIILGDYISSDTNEWMWLPKIY